MTEIDDYDYDLPQELIAQQPLAQRTDARLLVVDRSNNSIEHYHVRDLPEFLSPTDSLVLNDTQVIPARLVGYRTRTGGRWSGLFLSADEHGAWKVLGQTRGKLQPGESITLQDEVLNDRFQLRLLARLEGGAWAVKPETEGEPLSLLQQVGRVPLPPYIRGGEMHESDRASYQTVYADKPGAVAAPTAGLHFTEPLLQAIQGKNVGISRVTLHVGMGTFRPIAVDSLADHQMHAEWGSIDSQAAAELNERRAAGGRIVAIGTTAVRVLETAFADGRLPAWQGTTDLFIRPPYQWQAVDALMTNFHLPKSTLLVLVRTFGGDALIRRAYDVAIQEEYRFYSYGDAMLIL
jgi:S-adenosylmethionine:tRNA ribosyltransferase-isomerase